MSTGVSKYILIFILSTLFLGACSSSVRFASDKSSSTGKSRNASAEINYSNLSQKQSKIVKEAKRWIGTPYCYGGESRSCTDCSGYVMSVYQKVGVKLPRTAASQYKHAKRISRKNARTGDLVFFKKGSKINHVGIYIGNDNIIHASSSKGVIIQSLSDSYLNRRYAGIGRVI